MAERTVAEMKDNHVSEVFYGVTYKHLIKKLRRKKMTTQGDKLDERVTIGGWIITLLFVTVLYAWMYNGEVKRAYRDDALINAQQQTIEAQETIIDVQKGLISGLVIENNNNLLETNDYRARWLEAIK